MWVTGIVLHHEMLVALQKRLSMSQLIAASLTATSALAGPCLAILLRNTAVALAEPEPEPGIQVAWSAVRKQRGLWKGQASQNVVSGVAFRANALRAVISLQS